MKACEGAGDGTTCTITAPDDGVCDASICIPATCGDGYLTGGEACDGASFATVSNCQELGYYDDKPLGCNERCELDQLVCTGFCGDGVTNGEELCDSADPASTTCVDLGFGAGPLQCNSNCGPRFDACVPFGWKRVEMPQKMQAVHAVSSTNVWAVGGAGFVSHFDGSTWTTVATTGCATADDNLDRVFGVSDTEAFVQLESGGIGLVTATGCTLYPTTETFYALWAPSATELYAGGETGLFHLQSGTWNTVDSLRTQVIWGSGPTDIYATTDDLNDDAVDGMYRHFDGAAWSSPTTISGVHKLTALWGASASDVYLAGTDSSGAPVVMHKNGNTWLSVLDVATINGSTAIPFFGATAGGRTYVRLVDFYTGATPLITLGTGGWSIVPAPLDAQSLSGTSDGTVYSAAPAATHIYVLEGGLLAPMPMPPAEPGRVTRLAATRADRAIAVALPRALLALPVIWSWDGATWTNEGFSSVQDVVTFGGELYAIAAGTIRKFDTTGYWPTIDTVGGGFALTGLSDTEIWYTNGTTAVHRTPSATTQYVMPFFVNDVWEASPNFIVGVGVDGRIVHWTGTAWAEVTSPTTTTLRWVWGRSATEIYAWTTSQVLRFDGTSWADFPTPGGLIVDVWSGGPNDVFVASGNGLSHWDGQRWSPVETGSEFGASAVTGVGDALLIGNDDSVNELLRLRAW